MEPQGNVGANPGLLEASQDMLKRYGDVPVAYAVFRVVLNDTGDEVIDTRYVYANPLYYEWMGYGDDMRLEGKSFLETVSDASTRWFPYCYRAAVLHKGSHDVIFSPEINSWLSFNVEPSPIENCCIFAFTRVDKEHRQRLEIEAARDTAELIIHITKALNGALGYDEAMNTLLESMSTAIHPERLYIFERWEHTSDNTFEWCAPGIEPQIDLLQNLDNSEFDTWDRMLASDSVVVIPDVSAYKGVDDRLYELLTIQGIDRLLAVPFYDNGKLIGYLGADNYALDERLDTRYILETVASFVSARMVNRRLMDELAQVSTHDPLTGLLNRRGLDQELQMQLEKTQHAPFVLALLDVDDFKAINDLYGHAMGDEALRQLATLLKSSFPTDAIIGRNGGDEALMLLFGQNAEQAEERLQSLVSQKLLCESEGVSYTVTMSVGYTWCDGSDEDLKAAYTRADAALYSVKYNGKASFACFAHGMEERYRLQLGFAAHNVAEKLPEAVLVYDVESGRLLFANEALVALMGCSSVQELMEYTDRNVWNLVSPQERTRMQEALTGQEGFRMQHYTTVQPKDGAACDVRYSGKLVDLGDGRHVVYTLLFAWPSGAQRAEA